MKNHVILNKHQFGFQSEVPTENACHILLNEILEAMNSKQMVGGIFCDLPKAFDCINHVVLLEKLKFYGSLGVSSLLCILELSRLTRVGSQSKT